jgi:hypothetical protein
LLIGQLMVTGTCLCGTVRYEFDGPVDAMMNCHCSMCRKHHGSAFATFVTAPLAGFSWLSGEESVRTYASSASGYRPFCGVCGSVVPMLWPAMKLVCMPAGNLQGELGARPTAHMFVGSKAPWYTITDTLPQHETFPPEFAGAESVERPAISARPGMVEGSCLCGDVAYEISGEPMRFAYCFCSRCRRARSAAHATNLFYSLAHFRFTRGAEQVIDYKLSDARFFGTAFCKRCGSMVPRVSRERGAVVVPAGSLDVDPGVRPMMQICLASRAPWVEITDTVTPQFVDLPPPPSPAPATPR